jgi:hypothetical protein
MEKPEATEAQIKRLLQQNEERVVMKWTGELGNYIITSVIDKEPVYVVYRDGVVVLERLKTFSDCEKAFAYIKELDKL